MKTTTKGDEKMHKCTSSQTLKTLIDKSAAFGKKLITITEAGYSLKEVTELKEFKDSERTIYLGSLDDSGEHLLTKYEADITFEDNEERRVKIYVSLVSKFDGRKLKEFSPEDEAKLNTAVKETKEMNLDFMKLNVEYVEYVKGIESVERKNLRDLEKELEELGWL
jgi:hypothetical protein